MRVNLPKARRTWDCRLLLAGLVLGGLLATLRPAAAVTITNVTPVNVTPSSFSIFWRAGDSAPSIAVFADAGGATNLSGQLGIEVDPLNTGYAGLAAGYERRVGQAVLRQRTRSYGMMLVRVTGCRPGTTYYYQLTSTPSSGTPAVYPASGPLPSVTTEQENTFVVNAQQLVLEVPGVDNSGQIVLLNHPTASHPLAAVVGDGVGTNQVFFNANDLFAQVGGGNLTPMGAQNFTVDVLGPNQADFTAQFTLTFATNFTVGQGTQTSIGTEFLALSVGSTNLQSGQTSAVGLAYNSSANVVDLALVLNIPTGHLSGLTLQSLAPEIDPATATVTAQAGNNYLLHLKARTGQVIFGAKQIAQLAFTAIPGQPSAFVPLKLTSIVATKPDSSTVGNLLAQSGRLVVVGQESLVEITPTAGGTRSLMMYGKPGSSYALEFTTNLNSPATWNLVARIPLTTLAAPLQGLPVISGPVFYRTVEFTAEPPVLEAVRQPNGTQQFLVYGKPGVNYQIQYASALDSPVVWNPLETLTLTNSFGYAPWTNLSSGFLFYRVVESVGGTPVLQVQLQPDGSTLLNLQGRPGASYAIEFASALVTPERWTLLRRVPLAGTSTSFPGVDPNLGAVYYRASEFVADPPIAEAMLNPDQGRTLLVYGKAASQYTVLANTNLSNVVAWYPVLDYTLSNSFRYVNLGATNAVIFYRLQRH